LAAFGGRQCFAPARRADACPGFARHEGTDRAEQDHIDDRDDGIDLAALLQPAENERTRNGTQDSSHDEDDTHRHIDAAALIVRQRARDAGPGHLRCGGGGGDGGRDAVKDQQRRRQKPAADAKHARQDADARAEKDDDERVHRKVCDRQVNVHDRFA
jgi:hypothetical protein